MAKKLPEKWHISLDPHLNMPGCCMRCGTFCQADVRLQKKAPELELCTVCKKPGEQEFALANP